MVKLDVSNAFNSIRRDHLLECCRELVPFAYPLVHLSYACSSILMFNDIPIYSATGVQQGDPLGPVLFALGVNSIAHFVRSPVNIWYLDDATISGPPDAVFDDLRVILPSLSDIGLSINADKSKIVNIALNPSDFTASISTCRGILSDVRITDKSNLTILGAPMGPSALECSLAGKISHLSKMIDKLKVIEPHVAFFLLRNHFSVPKILYTLRCAPCFQRGDLLSDLDNILSLGTSSLCNLAFDDPGWTQASLPVRWGGLGLRSYSDLALPHSYPLITLLVLSQTSFLETSPNGNCPKFTLQPVVGGRLGLVRSCPTLNLYSVNGTKSLVRQSSKACFLSPINTVSLASVQVAVKAAVSG
ncbi:uncharacterized protein LOC115231182 [Octopus sinensis]|uniref:Uncharacterized protein LOC115231182 n=1 Tax=Octopus sinensis TaxID=2607531 RepID=A0A6P7U6L1_9MOLL|nr:uncharacterized protein LOC115231182 [Octopus sinensis]